MNTLLLPSSKLQQGPEAEGRKILPRGLALFLGGFGLVNSLGEFHSAHFDANLWWVDLRTLPPAIVTPFLLAASACLVGFAVWPLRSTWRRILTIGCVAALGVMAAANTAQFYALLSRGLVSTGIPIPLSLFVSIGLAIVLARSGRAVGLLPAPAGHGLRRAGRASV